MCGVRGLPLPCADRQLHHIQWFAWKDHKDYAKMLEPAPLLLNSRFVSLNPNNAAITVGLTTEALYRTRAPPLTVANTFLYGMYLLREEPVRRGSEGQAGCRGGAEWMMVSGAWC